MHGTNCYSIFCKNKQKKKKPNAILQLLSFQILCGWFLEPLCCNGSQVNGLKPFCLMLRPTEYVRTIRSKMKFPT